MIMGWDWNQFVYMHSLKKNLGQKKKRQAGAELGQAQDQLKAIVDVGDEVQVKVGAEVEVSVIH